MYKKIETDNNKCPDCNSDLSECRTIIKPYFRHKCKPDAKILLNSLLKEGKLLHIIQRCTCAAVIKEQFIHSQDNFSFKIEYNQCNFDYIYLYLVYKYTKSWFKLDAKKILTINTNDNPIELSCIHDEECVDCIETNDYSRIYQQQCSRGNKLNDIIALLIKRRIIYSISGEVFTIVNNIGETLYLDSNFCFTDIDDIVTWYNISNNFSK